MSSVYVSVIIPFYNEECVLSKCIESVLQQKFNDYEIVAVNDASTDNSNCLINEYSTKDRRIAVVEHEHNQGLGEARNTGIRHSKGKYIFFLDADDWIPTDALDVLCNIARCTNDDIIIGGTQSEMQVDNKFVLCEIRRTTLRNYPALLYNHNAWNKLIRRQFLLDNDLFFEPPRFAEDILFSVRSNLLANSISITRKTTYFYKWSRQVVNVTKPKITDAQRNVIRAYTVIENCGDPLLIQEMREKTARNAYQSMTRATRAFNKSELQEHLIRWQPALDKMPRSVLESIPKRQRVFCELIINNKVEQAIDYWRGRKRLSVIMNIMTRIAPAFVFPVLKQINSTAGKFISMVLF
ncbi:MAG: glycosyltransferase, partial [Gammaproteobacteria bacterium]|nr:glycosyltransferase [Gammaproteobacteria bacterium]